jgi:hypothetical protein
MRMVVVNCPACHKRRLLGLESITGLERTNVGLTVEYRCSCGWMGSTPMHNDFQAAHS